MKPKIAIIGGGAAGLSLASAIDTNIFEVQLFEKKNRIGSKLLVAGKGGFNLSHSEDIDTLKMKYHPFTALDTTLSYFTNSDLRQYFENIGIPTYIGSSRRIFPERHIKPIEVLNAIQTRIIKNNVSIVCNTEWVSAKNQGSEIELVTRIENELITSVFDYVIFALGGASWTVTGSAGDWLENFESLGIKTKPFAASNCSAGINWPLDYIKKYAGSPFKNISVSIEEYTHLGEIIVTEFGIEGTPIYALSSDIRKSLNQGIKPKLFIDFKPNSSADVLIKKLNQPQKENWTKHIQLQLKLTKSQLGLLKASTTKDEFLSAEKLVGLIKHFPLEIESLAPIEEAISTVGGIALSEVNDYYELKKFKNVFIIGEMLDWDAPTGGYLIQGCMSMGQYLANYLNKLK